MTALLVLLQRAALLVTPPTVGTLVGLSDCKQVRYVKARHGKARQFYFNIIKAIQIALHTHTHIHVIEQRYGIEWYNE